MATYSKEFKAEALRLSDEIGVKKAAEQLGIPYFTLADWRSSRKEKRREKGSPPVWFSSIIPHLERFVNLV